LSQAKSAASSCGQVNEFQIQWSCIPLKDL
jgi:hypothetical protein